MKRPYSELMEKANCIQYALAEKIYQLGREDAIDDLVKKVCEFGTALEHEECYAISPTTMKQTIADFGEQLKEQNK